MSTTQFDLRKLNQMVQASDIDFRVQSINKGGYATILAYKDARYDQRVLDDVVGPENWQKDYKIIDGNLYCGIGIYVNNHWVWKWDVGTESNTEKEKGQASDAQKRAGFAWGIGRELYDFPPISVKLFSDEFEVKADGKAYATWKLNIRQWNWEVSHESGSIRVVASDTNGEVRFDSSPKRPSAPKPAAPHKKESAHKAVTEKPSSQEPDDVFQKAIDYMKSNPTQQAYDAVMSKYGSGFSAAQQKALSKFIKK